jgi:hypothetical protein
MDMKMMNRLLAAVMTAALFVVGPAPTTVAQPPAKQHLAMTSLRAQLRDEIARMASLSPNEIEVHATNALIRVVFVNTDYNHRLPSGPADREYLASNIAALMNMKAEKDPGLKPILALHIEFVEKGLWPKTIDAIEFRRQADGKFDRHQT